MDRDGLLARFYLTRAERLRSTVAAQVRTSDATVLEDACQEAWLTLARREDITLDDRGAAWLATVAVREGWRLARPPRAVPSGPFRGEGGIDLLELPEPQALDGDPEARVIASETHAMRVLALKELRPDQSRDLYLQALGHSCSEIAALTGSHVRIVAGRQARGRRRLRLLTAAAHDRGSRA